MEDEVDIQVQKIENLTKQDIDNITADEIVDEILSKVLDNQKQ